MLKDESCKEAQKKTVTARNTGKTILKCPKPVPARAATSLPVKANDASQAIFKCPESVPARAATTN
eukprot:6180276-Pleurochrysis_carterae.AAC.1